MEKKTTQRIVGILVVIALVIILMPLLLDKNDAATQTASLKAPPFPDQPQAAPPLSVAEEDKNAPSSIYISPDIANKINHVATNNKSSEKAEAAPATKVADASKSKAETAAPKLLADASSTTATSSLPKPMQPEQGQPKFSIVSDPVKEESADATKTTVKPAAETSSVIASATATATAASEPAITPASTSAPEMAKAIKTAANETELKEPTKITHSIKWSKSHTVKTASATSSKKHAKKDLANLKKPAWAVQLGSFKNKDNARRLADSLRSAGYKAFMHEVKSSKGTVQTRVYIGPEYQQASAAKLSAQLEQKMKMHGLIVPYKPLEI